MHTPSRAQLGKLLEVPSHGFVFGAEGSDFVVEGASDSGSRLEICCFGAGADGEAAWQAEAEGAVTIDRETVTRRMLVSGDEFRMVDSFFRFLCGPNVQSQYHETIYRMTIVDVSTGIHNKRYLQEAIERELMRASRRGTRLAVAVLTWESSREVASHDQLREVADRISKRLPSGWLLARNADLEVALVAPDTSAEELELCVRGWLRGCAESAAANRLGVAESDGDSLDSIALVAMARSKAW